MTSLACSESKPVQLRFDRGFCPCEAMGGDEIYPNGIFEFNITRLLAYINGAGRFRAEHVALVDIPYAGISPRLNELTVLNADLSRPVILAEIAPARFNLIDGHHRASPRIDSAAPSMCPFSPLCGLTRRMSSTGIPRSTRIQGLFGAVDGRRDEFDRRGYSDSLTVSPLTGPARCRWHSSSLGRYCQYITIAYAYNMSSRCTDPVQVLGLHRLQHSGRRS